MMETNRETRYGWLDVMKLISIFFVYVVHYEGMGRYGLLFLSALVPCFFFCSGFTAYRHEQDAFLPFLKSKLLHIVWPYFVFGAFSLAVRALILEMPLGEIITWGKRFLFASRATVPVAALWFLPCLFCMSLLYHALHKLLKSPWVLLGICFLASAAVKLLHEAPFLPWGIDMAVRFLVYYALGDVAHSLITRYPMKSLRGSARYLLLAFTAVNAALFYFHFYYENGYFFSLLGLTEPSYFAQSAEQFIFALNNIWCVGALAMVLGRIPALCRAGRYTLIFCGIEQIVKTLVPLFFSAFGLTISEAGGAVMLLQAIGLLLIGYYVFARPIQRWLPWMLGNFSSSNADHKVTAHV